MELRQATTDTELFFIRQLFEEYASSLEFSLSFQDFANEQTRECPSMVKTR